jgi:hypothetical protein
MNAEYKKQMYIDFAILAGLALLANLLTFIFQKVPGYMDAEYYFAGALNLFRGNGFSESYIWNTLSLPPTLPFASHLYWMPLPSMVGSLGLFLFNSESYFYARFFFVLLSMLIPLITYRFSKELGGSRNISFISGLMAVFPGVYLVYQSLTESFSLYMFLGGLILLLAYRILTYEYKPKITGLIFLILGVLAALMHLSRADGILWLGFCGLIPVYWLLIKREWKKGLSTGVILLAAYSLIMFPWYYRNWQLFHQLFPPGNQYTLFLTEYNDNFIFPVEQLSAQRWLASGWGNILTDRLKAFGTNLLTGWMIQFEIVLIPFFVIWIKKNWHLLAIRWALLCYALQFVFMSVIFPYAGMRGGFLHSGSAFQVLFWSTSTIGLFEAIHWLMKKKEQFDERIPILLSSGMILIMAIVTGMMYQQKVFGTDLNLNNWQISAGTYDVLNKELVSHGITEKYSVMINNPPGFYLASGGSAIVVPNGDIEDVKKMASLYDMDYLVLDTHIVPQLADFYQNKKSVPGVEFIFESGEFHVYSFTSEGK